MKKILVAEDELNIREFVVLNLKMSGYEVIEASNGRDAIAAFEKEKDIDICILDIMMPEMSGDEACGAIRRANSFVGIIMLTAKSQESDKLNSFLYGADDYVTKPFSPSELVARVDALYRRVVAMKENASKSAVDEEFFGEFTISHIKHAFYKRGVKIILTEIEYRIIEYLLKNKGELVSRKDLLKEVWDDDTRESDYKIVDVNMRRLRIKIEDDPSEPKHILTVWGKGYKWE
jgi:DNA-binding response OmpR family regulator